MTDDTLITIPHNHLGQPDLQALVERAGRRHAESIGEKYVEDPFKRPAHQGGYQRITPDRVGGMGSRQCRVASAPSRWTQHAAHKGRAMTDLLLMLVVDVLVLALAVDLAAVLAWVRGRWRRVPPPRSLVVFAREARPMFHGDVSREQAGHWPSYANPLAVRVRLA